MTAYTVTMMDLYYYTRGLPFLTHLTPTRRKS